VGTSKFFQDTRTVTWVATGLTGGGATHTFQAALGLCHENPAFPRGRFHTWDQVIVVTLHRSG